MTTSLAVSLALKAYHVSVCDMDSHSPNIPKMMGTTTRTIKTINGVFAHVG